jgi:hemerythrin-like domain-containing protein
MKRHPALIPISREHHQMLLLARLLQNDAPPYKGLPTVKEEKLEYAGNQFELIIENHFQKEDRVFSELKLKLSMELQQMVEELIKEHILLRKKFHNLGIESLDETGKMLEKHIRKEERVFFENIQKELGDDLNDLVEL